MKPKEMLANLEAASRSLAVKVSYESIASSVMPGGLCKVKGEYRVILDKRLTIEERVNTLADALSRFDHESVPDMDKETAALLAYYSARRARNQARAVA